MYISAYEYTYPVLSFFRTIKVNNFKRFLNGCNCYCGESTNCLSMSLSLGELTNMVPCISPVKHQ